MLERWQERGETLYRFLPHAPGWSVRWRQPDARARQLAIDTEAWLFARNAATPQEQDLPLPPELPSFEDAFAEVSRESALADEQRGGRHLVTEVSLAADPSHPSDRARLDAGVPDIQSRPCRQPSSSSRNNNSREQKPVAGAREVGAPATAPTSAAAELSAAATTSAAPRLLAASTSDMSALADATPVESSAKRWDFAALKAHLQHRGNPAPVGDVTNSTAEASGQEQPAGWLRDQPDQPESPSSWLRHQSDSAKSHPSWLHDQPEPPEPSVELVTSPTPPRERAPTHTQATDVPEHPRHPLSSVKRQLPSASAEHPDVADGCCRHQGEPDGASRPDAAEWTGNLHTDLRQAMGEAGWAQYHLAWQSYLAVDRLTVTEVLGDYRQALASPRRRPAIRNPGAWMRQRFLATSSAWRRRTRPTVSPPPAAPRVQPASHHLQPCPNVGNYNHA